MKIGVLGGSFDPPHLGHRALAALAEDQLQLDLVLWVVAASPWQKAVQTSPDLRAHMCELAVAAHPRWQVSYADIDRGGATYTIDTLRDLKLAWPEAELVVLLGADAAAGLPAWHRSEELAQSAQFAAAARAASPQITPARFDIQWLDGSLPDIASTQIRTAVAAGADAEMLNQWLEPAVTNFILEVGLYR